MSELESGRDTLARFAMHLFAFVGAGLERHSREFQPEALDRVLKLWSAQEPRFQRLYAALGRSAGDTRDAPLEYWPDLDERLAAAGLTGHELEFKVVLFEEAAKAHDQKPSPSKFGAALEAADVALGSLSRVFTFLDPVKEAKEAIEFLFSWGRRWFRRRFLRRRG